MGLNVMEEEQGVSPTTAACPWKPYRGLFPPKHKLWAEHSLFEASINRWLRQLRWTQRDFVFLSLTGTAYPIVDRAESGR